MLEFINNPKFMNLCNICDDLEIEKWLEIVDMLEQHGGETENFSFKDWFVLWLVKQNDVLFRNFNQYFTLQGFFDISEVVPDAPIFKDKEDLNSVLNNLVDKGLVTMRGE